MMDARNHFLYVVDADGTEHHVNLDTVVEVTFDQAGVASLYTAAPLPAQQGERYTVTGEAATRLRAALVRREGWASAPVAGHLPELRRIVVTAPFPGPQPRLSGSARTARWARDTRRAPALPIAKGPMVWMDEGKAAPGQGGREMPTRQRVSRGVCRRHSGAASANPLPAPRTDPYRARGKRTLKTAPPPLRLVTAIVPPWACAIHSAIASPSPAPPSVRARAVSTR